MKLKINPEFKKCIPSLTEDEFQTLEKSLINEGCRDAIVIWNSTIVDGHNRYKICQDQELDFNIIEREFDSEDAAKIWIIDNQKGRRNLTDGWKWELAQTKKALLLEKGKKTQGVRTDLLLKNNKKSQDSSLLIFNKDEKPSEPKHNTQKELAKDLGWSASKVGMADKVWKEADENTKERIKNGDESIGGAYQKLEEVQRKLKRKEIIKKEKQEIDNFERLKKHALALAEGLNFWADTTMIPENEDEVIAAKIVLDCAASIITHYSRLGINIQGIYNTFIDPNRRDNNERRNQLTD